MGRRSGSRSARAGTEETRLTITRTRIGREMQYSTEERNAAARSRTGRRASSDEAKGESSGNEGASSSEQVQELETAHRIEETRRHSDRQS